MRLSELRMKYPDYIPITQVSKITGVWRNKIKKLIDMGKIHPVTLYRVRMTYYLISPEDVKKILEFKDTYVIRHDL